MPDVKKLIMGFQQDSPRLYEALREIDKNVTTIQESSGLGAGGRAYGRFYYSQPLVVPTGVSLSIPMDTNRFINGIIHDTNNNNTKIFIARRGWYNMGANIRVPALTAGTVFSVTPYLNQAIWLTSDSGVGDGTNFFDLTTHCGWFFEEGDFIEFRFRQNSGGNVTVPRIDAISPEIWISEA